MGTMFYLGQKPIGKRHSHNRWTFCGDAMLVSSYDWFQLMESLPMETRVTTDNGTEGDITTIAELVSYIKGAERSSPEVDPNTPDFIHAHCWWDAWGYKFCRGEWC